MCDRSRLAARFAERSNVGSNKQLNTWRRRAGHPDRWLDRAADETSPARTSLCREWGAHVVSSRGTAGPAKIVKRPLGVVHFVADVVGPCGSRSVRLGSQSR